MAITTLAGIGLALAGVGSVVASKSAGKAADRAAAATTQAADRSADVIQRNYDLSARALQPWQQSGLGANAMLNDFYGIGQQQQATQNLPVMSEQVGLGGGWNDLAYGGGFGGLGGFLGQPPMQQQMVNTPAPNSRDAFRSFIENSDYGFQFGEGANRINSGYAGAGALKSGAAMKDLERFRQNLQQGYRGEFLGGLANQQNVGFGAASAQAGVSQNLGNSLANIYTNQGGNLANAALAKSGSGIGNTLGLLGGGLFGLSRG